MSREDHKRLGDYIREVDERNRELKVTNLVGLTINKAFIPSVANVIGTDLSTYKVIRKEQFACSLMQVSRDGKMPIAMFEDDAAIMSPAYPMFEVIDKSKLMPHYLMMWFSRKEFDREASFYAVGGVRGSLTWEDFCDMKLPIPSIERQREIVAEYETLSKRIRLNEQMISSLEATAQTLYRKMFVDGIDKENLPDGWRIGILGDYAKVKSGYAFPSSWWQKDGIPVIKIGSITNNSIEDCDYVSLNNGKHAVNYSANTGDIVIAMTGATLGKIAIVPKDGYLVNQRVGLFELSEKLKAPFLYWTLQQDDIVNEILTVGGDSAQANVSNSDIEEIKLLYAPKEQLGTFNTYAGYLLSQIILKQKANKKLTELQSLLLAKMGQ
jgi:type I restriction enzyme S subunit